MAFQYFKAVGDPLFQSNSYILYCDETGEGIIVDPGAVGSYEAELRQRGVTLTAIVNTHGHLDHVYGAAQTQRAYSIPFSLHSGDRFLIEGLNTFTAGYGLPPLDEPTVDRWLEHGDIVTFGCISLEVIHTPGHSPGGVCLYHSGHLFSGDTLFAGSIGRFDLPGGDEATLFQSIRERILTLPPETILHPGHGPDSTVGREAAHNPFLI